MEGCYACEGLRRLVPYSSFQYSLRTLSGHIPTCRMNGTHFQGGQMGVKFQIFTPKIASRACSSRYFPNGNFNGTLPLVMDEESCKVGHPQLIIGPSLEQDINDKIPEYKIEEYLSQDLGNDLQDITDRAITSAKGTTAISDREIQRRRKIGHANKGRTPWNKGRKHSQETRDLIKKRTIEALRDPKVKKKMSGCSRAHSDLSKARIGTSLRRIWAERLKHKKSQEKCYLIWARSISEAAKKGGLDQQELGWDSYKELKSDLMFQYLQWESEKAMAKELRKLRAERMAKVRGEKLAKLAQQRKEKEERAKSRKIEAMARKKLKDEKRKMALSQGLKLKARLTKLHPCRKQSESSDNILEEVVIEPQSGIKNWDIECITVEKMQRRVSLADQIRALKNKKTEFATEDIFIIRSSKTS